MIAIPEFSFSYLVDPEPAEVGYARALVRKILPGWGLEEHDGLLQPIVSELVTNALPHCSQPIKVCLSFDGTIFSIKVQDNRGEMPVRRDPSDDDESGRGLQLIDELIGLHGSM